MQRRVDVFIHGDSNANFLYNALAMQHGKLTDSKSKMATKHESASFRTKTLGQSFEVRHGATLMRVHSFTHPGLTSEEIKRQCRSKFPKMFERSLADGTTDARVHYLWFGMNDAAVGTAFREYLDNLHQKYPATAYLFSPPFCVVPSHPQCKNSKDRQRVLDSLEGWEGGSPIELPVTGSVDGAPVASEYHLPLSSTNVDKLHLTQNAYEDMGQRLLRALSPLLAPRKSEIVQARKPVTTRRSLPDTPDDATSKSIASDPTLTQRSLPAPRKWPKAGSKIRVAFYDVKARGRTRAELWFDATIKATRAKRATVHLPNVAQLGYPSNETTIEIDQEWEEGWGADGNKNLLELATGDAIRVRLRNVSVGGRTYENLFVDVKIAALDLPKEVTAKVPNHRVFKGVPSEFQIRLFKDDWAFGWARQGNKA